MIGSGRRPLKVQPVSLGLVALAALAVLAAGIWPLDATAPVTPAGAPPLDLADLAAAETGAALARPLFDPERRAWTARGDRESLTAEARPRTMLSVRGILIENGIGRALVADGTGTPTWLSPGDGGDAWRLVSVEPTQVVVADAGRQYTLAFLGAPVALHPVPRYPGPGTAALRPALGSSEAAVPVRPVAEPGAPVSVSVPVARAAPVRRIAIDPPGR